MNAVSGSRRLQTPARQRGVVLAIALIFMVVLTLLGLTTMGNSMLEERMAGNLQAKTQAFQAAETGVARLLSGGEFGTSDSCTGSGDFISQGDVGTGASAKTCPDFLQALRPGRERTAQGQESIMFNHFDIHSVGETQSLARNSVAQGIRVLGPTEEGVLTETGGDQ